MTGAGDNPLRQLAAAWHAAADVAAEWGQRTASVTAEAFGKLTSDPAVRAVLERWRNASVLPRPECECSCADSHPDDMGICDNRAVITRKLPGGRDGGMEAALCAPCAVAQGVAELPT